jgi:catechol 2,3-dioxygenase-like lactoylglutathione lyase family enzyme
MFGLSGGDGGKMERQINQIGLSVSNLAESTAWYGALGLEASGGFGPVGSSEAAKMMRLPEVEARGSWLVGRNPMVQLELTYFSKPTPRPLLPTRTARDEGYGSISIAVVAFEQQLSRLKSNKVSFEITGVAGRRSLWVRDPDGIPVELLESDFLRSEPVQADGANLAGIRAASLTVRDIQQAEEFWISALGFSPISAHLGASNPLPSWWSDRSDWQERIVKGGSVLVRLLAPASGDIINRPSDYGLSDIGVQNIAAISDGADAHQHFVENLRVAGFEFAISVPLRLGSDSGVMYGYDRQGNSVETGYIRPGTEEIWGWRR